jgi:transposase
MSKVPEKESKILKASRYIEKGQLSQGKIAAALHISKNHVSIIARKMAENGWTSQDVESMSEEQRKEVFKRKDLPEPAVKKEILYAEPDYEYLCRELLKPGVNKATLHEEYVEDCRRAGLVPLQLTQFKVHMNEHLQTKSFSEIIHHRPGEETEVDWTGDPAHWHDPDTGEVVTGWLFVGVLPFSGYGYAEVFPDMKLPNWIMAHVHMYEYFGGTTRVLICDNLKTGVIKHPVTGDVILQTDYEAFANYYGMVVEPARVKKPNDKGTVENLVGNLESYILAKLRNFQCFSIGEYNAEVRKYLDKFNAKPFQKKEGSRLSSYLDYERTEMIPLPSVPYEYYQKKLAKVQSNCCISYAKNFYSVPYRYIGSTVILRIYHNHIDIYSGDEKLCSHGLIVGRTGLYVTDNSHFPPHSSNYGDWNSSRFRRWAEDYGPYTYEVIDKLFRYGGAEQKYYNSARSILKLADLYSPARVEQACQLALKHFKRPVYRNIKAILYAGQDLKEAQIQDQNSDTGKQREEKSHVRGAAYYAKK